jgi:putative tryptophan/tyrosine transport system substrate-binding protein
VELQVLNASSEHDFDAAFANLIRLRAGGLVITADSVFLRGIEQLATLTVRHALPAIYQFRKFVAAGGLISYGPDIRESYLIAGNTGRILKGEKPADLPIQQVTKVEMYINLKTASGCCARAASGHAAAAPPSVAKNFRRPMWLAI